MNINKFNDSMESIATDDIMEFQHPIVKIPICEVCEEESTCDYVINDDSNVCCPCDDDMEINHRCASCFSDYASNIYDNYKDEQLRGMK